MAAACWFHWAAYSLHWAATDLQVLHQWRDHDVGEKHKLLQLLGRLQAVVLRASASHKAHKSLTTDLPKDVEGFGVGKRHVLLDGADLWRAEVTDEGGPCGWS